MCDAGKRVGLEHKNNNRLPVMVKKLYCVGHMRLFKRPTTEMATIRKTLGHSDPSGAELRRRDLFSKAMGQFFQTSRGIKPKTLS